MIRLIALNNPRVAQAFIDYMASRQIEIQMMPEGGISLRCGWSTISTKWKRKRN